MCTHIPLVLFLRRTLNNTVGLILLVMVIRYCQGNIVCQALTFSNEENKCIQLFSLVPFFLDKTTPKGDRSWNGDQELFLLNFYILIQIVHEPLVEKPES